MSAPVSHPVFVDTNILAYARDARDLRKKTIALDWLSFLAKTRTGRLSWQVLAEFYAVATHPKKLAVPMVAAQADVLSLQHWQPVVPSADLFKAAWGVQDGYGFSWRDSSIVAAAILSGCKILLSEDLQHEQMVNNTLQIINPFAPNTPAPGVYVQ
ncbi:MAG: PIN domain-containing protein [Azoarcus sp.]|jgi:predicted nucleic acid-binding protein|nr:PIN domain-containing protein [Azoarcus sp.]